jgi:hypothetical protein
MKTKSLLALGILIFSGSVAFSASNNDETASKQLEIYPKNLARQHVGTNLFVFNPTNQNYVPTEASAAWLDDDVATGWPPLPGKNYYLVSLSQPQLLTNFSLSTKAGSSGMVTISAGDEPAPPTAKSWTVLAKDLSIDAINNKKLTKPFSRFAKYLLIETNIADPNPWYSIYLYSEKPSTGYHIAKRAAPIDTKSIFGPFVNNQTVFNLSSLYANSTVVYSNMDASATDLQKSIDDNPESSITIAPSKDQSGLVIRYGEPREIQRLSIMTDPSAKGRLDFYLVNNPTDAQPVPAPAPVTSNAQGSQYLKVVNTEPAQPAPAQTTGGPIAVDKLTPTATLVLDGSTGRGSIDFPPVLASNMIVRWTPETAGQNLAINEINSFGDLSLNDYELVSDLPAVGEQTPDVSKDEKDSKDTKDSPAPVGELLPGKDPFDPAPLGFPPNQPTPLSP